MAPSVQTPFSQALNAVTNGNVLLPLFKANHITSCAQLLAWAPSFLAAAVLDSNDVLAMHLALEQASTTPQLPAWPTDSTKGARYIRTIVIAARGLLASETSATVPAGAAPQLVQAPNAANTTTAGNNTVAGSANAEALSAKGQKLYDLAALMYGSTGTGAIKLEAEHHVKYEIIGRLNAAALARRPAALPLADFHLELAVQHGKEETYTAFGQQWVSRESSDKSVKIVDEATLLSMMQRRATAYAVSGAWDFPAHLVAKGLPAPLYPQKLSDSGIVYVDNGKVVSIDAFATPAGQMLEIEAMRDFRRRHPHVPIAKCVTIIDAGVQRAVANLLLKNYSRDAAVFQSCVRSTELYSLTLVQGNDNSSTEGTAETNGTTGEKNNKKQKTDAEARQAAERKNRPDEPPDRQPQVGQRPRRQRLRQRWRPRRRRRRLRSGLPATPRRPARARRPRRQRLVQDPVPAGRMPRLQLQDRRVRARRRMQDEAPLRTVQLLRTRLHWRWPLSTPPASPAHAQRSTRSTRMQTGSKPSSQTDSSTSNTSSSSNTSTAAHASDLSARVRAAGAPTISTRRHLTSRSSQHTRKHANVERSVTVPCTW